MPTTTPTIPALREEVRALKAEGKGNPRIHPNGFIQLDLDHVADGWHASHQRGHSGGTRRLHIWNPPGVQLPRQDTVNEIHDHVFDMKSTVIKGVLEQCLYEFVIGGSTAWPVKLIGHTHEALPLTDEIYRAVYQKGADSRLEPTGVRGYLRKVVTTLVRAGESYYQPAFTLHDTQTPDGRVVTVMEKLAVHEGDATVICPIDVEPDNDFDRASAMSADDIWDAIERSLA